VKSVASWFPAKETGLALGIVNAAPNVGAIVVPLAIPAMALAVGWRMTFVVVGAVGLVWVLLWLAARPPTPPADVSLAALEASDASWGDLLKDRRVHGFMIAKVLTDQMWWLMMFWLPDFFMRSFGLTSGEVARPTAFVYVLAMAGALSSGVVASRLIGGGASAAEARMKVLFGYGALALLAPLALFAGSLWGAALLIGIVLFAHQGFSTNLFGCVVDVFPARRVASVISMGALAGNLWGAVVLEITGRVLAAGGSYLPLFVAGGSGYLLGALVIRALLLRPVRS
jgi:ACS family hexuronate transporter-like MFS transporter